MAVFWALLLSHLLGDFVLQSDRLVAAKHRLPGLLVHGGIHFVVSVFLLFSLLPGVWLTLLLLAGLHLVIDSLKLSRERPGEQSSPALFLLDQAAHLLLIAGVARWIVSSFPSAEPWLGVEVLVAAVGLTLVTFVWAISEQIFAEGRGDQQGARELAKDKNGRIAARAAFFLGTWLLLGGVRDGALAGFVPYRSGRHRLRALVTDLVVSVAAAALLRLVA